MSDEMAGQLNDKNRLLFGSGFVFGVTFMLIVVAMVAARVAVQSDARLTSDVVLTITAGTFFVALIGLVLYLLAFPANRVKLPVGSYLDPDRETGKGEPTEDAPLDERKREDASRDLDATADRDEARSA